MWWVEEKMSPYRSFCEIHGLDYEEILAEWNKENWSLTREKMRWINLNHEIRLWVDPEQETKDEQRDSRVVQRDDLLPPHGAEEDPGIRVPAGRAPVPQEAVVVEPVGSPRDGHLGVRVHHGIHRTHHRRRLALLPSRGWTQVSERSILWGFLGAGFAAPIDCRAALALAVMWCFVIATINWRPEDSNGE